MSTDLAAAWHTFEHGDVRPVDLLCLRWADLDNERLARLQQQAHSGKPATRRKAAKELLDIVGHLPTPELFDGVLATAAADAGDRDEAMALRMRALALTPRWHPNVAGRVIGNIGWALQQQGRIDEAVGWFQRALAFDPTNPFALGSLAEIWAEHGDRENAARVRRWLRMIGAPDEHAADLDRKLGKIERKGPCWTPSLEGMRTLSARDWSRLVATCLTDGDTPIWRRLRALALGAAMHGQVGMAQLYAAEALESIDETDDDVDPLERAWIAATSRMLGESGIAAEPANGEARGGEFDEANAAGDRERLRKFLCDPIAAIRVMAAEQLGGDDGRAYLEEVAALESEEGDAAAAPEAWGASLALWRVRVKAIGPQPLVVIPEDLRPTSPAKLGKREGIVMWATFPGVFSAEQGAWFDRVLAEAAADIAKAEPKAQVYAAGNGQTLEIVIRDGRSAELIMRALGSRFSAAESQLRELVLGRFELPGGKRHVFHATPDPEAREVEEPSMIMIGGPDGHIPEVRLAPAQFTDVRVEYDLPDVERPVRDASDATFDEALRDALARAFRGVPPACSACDPIAYDGRRGHAIALSGLCPELVVHYPRCFRFREHELLGALRDVILRLDLAPVIHWGRSEGTWIFNVWRR